MAWCCPNCGMQVPGTPERNDCWRCNPSSAPAGYVSQSKAPQCSSTPSCENRQNIEDEAFEEFWKEEVAMYGGSYKN
jgi:hypothetical protein